MTELFETPILLIIFKRPDTTRQVLDAIRKCRPKYLYIAADAPRVGNQEEILKCKKTRELVLNSIDWPCTVFTQFQDIHKGCAQGMVSAINWFFSQVPMGIIVEDDCVPHSDFFPYCEGLLHYYKNDKSVMSISGSNSLGYTKYCNYSYFFGYIPHSWGWASWQRAWQHYSVTVDHNYKYFLKKHPYLRLEKAQSFWYNIFSQCTEISTHFWDYQWTYTIFKNRGYCINPVGNLVTHIGCGPDSTHFLQTNTLLFTPSYPVGKMKYVPQKDKKRIPWAIIRKQDTINFGIPKTTCKHYLIRIPGVYALYLKLKSMLFSPTKHNE